MPIPSHPTMGLLTKSMVRQSHLKGEEKNIKDPLSRQIRSQLLACSKQKHFIHPHTHLETFSKDKQFVRVLIEMRAITKKTHFQNHLQKTHSTNTSLNYFQNNTLYAFLQKREPLQRRHLFKITFKNTFHKHVFELFFSKQNFVRILIETRTITKTFSKYFQSPHHKHTRASDLASN